MMFDVYVMLGFGLFGFAFHKMKYPMAPQILGVILGPMADENLRKAIMIFQGQGATMVDILSRPIGTILIVVLLLTFYDGIFRRGRER
jgi:putative tricarboxylic transport membrane protein